MKIPASVPLNALRAFESAARHGQFRSRRRRTERDPGGDQSPDQGSRSRPWDRDVPAPDPGNRADRSWKTVQRASLASIADHRAGHCRPWRCAGAGATHGIDAGVPRCPLVYSTTTSVEGISAWHRTGHRVRQSHREPAQRTRRYRHPVLAMATTPTSSPNFFAGTPSLCSRPSNSPRFQFVVMHKQSSGKACCLRTTKPPLMSRG